MNINIYRTIDAGNNWFHLLDKSYRSIGLNPIPADPCVRIRQTRDGRSITATYTDDVLGILSSKEEVERIVKEIKGLYEFKFFRE
jgi:hypothetical protein